jgi:uncharacterized protein (UPF0335 family)
MAKADIFDDTPKAGDNSGAVKSDELRSFVERFERVQGEIDDLKEDQKEIKNEAKARGYDMKAFAEMIKLRKLDMDERKEREAIRDLYAGALGVFG